MEEATTTYCRKLTMPYASHATKSGDKDLLVDIYLPNDADAPVPLVTWLHSGGFRSGTRRSRNHRRMADEFARNGYATAFIDYRLARPAAVLSAETSRLAPRLVADAITSGTDLNFSLLGERAFAVVEDCAAFLGWAARRGDEFGLNREFLLGGSSSGAISALNTLFLAPHFGLELPPIRSVLISGGGFGYPNSCERGDTPILALHNPTDARVSIASIRRLARALEGQVTLVECENLNHGDILISPDDDWASAIDRFITFDRRGPEAMSDLAPATVSVPLRDPYSVCLVATMKNEGPYILEWIAYNQSIGATEFLIFSNHCDDGTDEILDRLDRLGVIRHLPNPAAIFKSNQFHRWALAYAAQQKELRGADYVFITDVDEFLQIKVGKGTYSDLIRMHGAPDVISVSEVIFGFGEVLEFEDKPVIEQFLKSSTLTPGQRRARRGVKSIVKVGDHVLDYSNHRPAIRPESLEGLAWTDGSGRPVPAEFAAGADRGLDARGTYGDAILNHFTLRSGESMLLKYDRGDAVRPSRLNESYILKRNQNVVENRTMLASVSKMKNALQALKKDAELSRLHDKAVAIHRKKIDQMKRDPKFRNLWDTIRENCGVVNR